VPCNEDARNKRQGWCSASNLTVFDCALHARAEWAIADQKIYPKAKE
jgi:hypothetical protein